MRNRILFWNSFNALKCKVSNRLIAYIQMALANQTTYGLLVHSILSYKSAMHSIEIKIPAGNGITCGVLLAGAFSGKT